MARFTRSAYAIGVVVRVFPAVRKIWQALPCGDLDDDASGPGRAGTTQSESELPMTRFITIVFVCVLGGSGAQLAPATPHTALATTVPASEEGQMQLGNFSVSLAVKDIAASRAFYEKLG